MQLSKLISDSALPLAPTVANFPGLLLAFTSAGVVQGDGVTTKGSITDPITGRVFTPASVADAFINTVPAGTFGTLNGDTGIMVGSGASMPALGTKHLLMISVRHAASAAEGSDFIGASAAGGQWNSINTRGDNSVLAVKDSTNYMTSGAVTGYAAGVWAHATVFDRSKATGILAITPRIAGAAANLAIAGSVKTGSTWTVTTDALNNLGPDVVFAGVASGSANYHYGVYLFGFTNPAGITSPTGVLQGSLNSILQWMQRNPTKGLHPFLAKLT